MRSPLLIGVTELRRRPGTQREVIVATALPGLAITTARVADDAEIAVDVVLEAVEGGITLQGRLSAPWTGECRRCLEDVNGVVEVELSEVFEPQPTPGETYPIDGDDLDLEPLVRDAVLLHLPLAPAVPGRLPRPGTGGLPDHGRGRAAGDDGARRAAAGTPAGPPSTSCGPTQSDRSRRRFDAVAGLPLPSPGCAHPCRARSVART